jgi:hypothetical protein
MTKFVSAYSDDASNTVVSVSEAFAKSAGLKTLKEPATDKRGRPLPPREGHRTSATTAANTTNGGKAASKPEEASK